MSKQDDEMQNIISQLQELQIQQTELLERLGRARRKETRSLVTEARGFEIGDKVEVKNPSAFQNNKGMITKIGISRITIRTKSGSLITRVPKNLIIDDERK